MDIVVDVNSWIRAAVGGAMIGLAAASLFAFNGRIAGISGVVGGLLFDRQHRDTPWRSLFVAGLVLGAAITALAVPGLAVVTMQSGWAGTILAGLVVGFGTRMGSGCTSGHGVCGIGRLSGRSMVATGSFMVAGVVTVFVTRHLLGAGS